MLSRFFPLLLTVCLTSSVWAADDPMVSKWKVNPSKSKLYDEMKLEVAGANRYAFTFGPGQVDTVVADGSDQAALSGTTLSITVKGPNSWEVVRKMKGRTLLRAQWTLSEDGKTLNDAFTQYLPDGTTLFSQPLPDGSTLFLPYVYERTTGNSGFLGTWDSEQEWRRGLSLRSSPTRVTACHLNVPMKKRLTGSRWMGAIIRTSIQTGLIKALHTRVAA
jgi:hypothetical protein